jgi:hypothetical protein
MIEGYALGSLFHNSKVREAHENNGRIVPIQSGHQGKNRGKDTSNHRGNKYNLTMQVVNY